MSIPDTKLMHGAALVPMIEYDQFKALNKPNAAGKNLYVLNNDTPFLVKFARKTTSAGLWPFTFSAKELAAGRELVRRHGTCFAILVCYPGTVCLLDWKQLSRVLNVSSFKSEAIRCETPKAKWIRVEGGRARENRQLKVAATSFPKKLFRSPTAKSSKVAA